MSLKHVETKVFDRDAARRKSEEEARRILDGARNKLRPTTTRESNPLEAMQAFHASWQATANEILSQVAGTCVNAAAFAGNRFKTGAQPPGLATRILTLDEWKSASNVFLRPRSQLTQKVDDALQKYVDSAEAMMRKHASVGPMTMELRRKPGIDRLAGDIQQRLITLQQFLKPEVEAWLRDKSANQRSARRPALEQLRECILSEEILLSSAWASVDANIRAGTVVGAWA